MTSARTRRGASSLMDVFFDLGFVYVECWGFIFELWVEFIHQSTFLLLSSVIFSAFCANKQGVLVWNIELAYHEEKDSSTSLATAKL